MKTKLFFLATLLSLSSFAQIELVKDLNPGPANGTPENFHTFKNRLYFTAEFNNLETMVVSDGTDTGTVPVKDDANFNIRKLSTTTVELGNYMYFGAFSLTHKLLRTDGSVVENIPVPTNILGFKNITTLSKFNNEVYFSADYLGRSQSLFKTDGTTITLVKDVYSGTQFGIDVRTKLANSQYLFFKGYTDISDGLELWRSDGTEAGTVMVKDINPNGNGVNFFEETIIFNDILYFVARDGVHGNELWRSDGTEAGTYMVKDIHTASWDDSDPKNFTILNNELYFIASDDSDNLFNLWKTDGTEAGTVKVKQIGARIVADQGAIITYNNNLYIYGDNELWKSDGTTNGTNVVTGAPIGVSLGVLNDESASVFDVYRGKLYFLGVGELWETDGTSAGTTAISSSSLTPRNLVATEDVLFCTIQNSAIGNELYKYENNATASTANQEIDKIGMYYNNQQLTISGVLNEKTTVKVYNLLGQEIINTSFIADENTQIPFSAKTGIYIANIETKTGKTISKKFIVE